MRDEKTVIKQVTSVTNSNNVWLAATEKVKVISVNDNGALFQKNHGNLNPK
mgnify:CR=1 FL=1